MSRTAQQLEFFRQQRRLAGALEASCQKAVSILVTVQFLEQKLNAADKDSSQAQSLKRAIASNRKTLSSAVSDYYDVVIKMSGQPKVFYLQQTAESCS